MSTSEIRVTIAAARMLQEVLAGRVSECVCSALLDVAVNTGFADGHAHDGTSDVMVSELLPGIGMIVKESSDRIGRVCVGVMILPEQTRAVLEAIEPVMNSLSAVLEPAPTRVEMVLKRRLSMNGKAE